jgi:hypothetical protein
MPIAARKKPSRRTSDHVIAAADLRAHAPAEAARLRRLPEARPDVDSPELDDAFFSQAQPTHRAIPSWPVRPPGRPAGGAAAPATAVVSLRIPRSLRSAVQRRARSLHVSFNAAMQMAAATWVGAEPAGQRRVGRQ